MKLRLIFFIVSLGFASLACWQSGGTEAQPAATPDPATVWVNDTRTLADGSVIVRTENRTIIKASGWQMPLPLPEPTKYHATTVVIDGKLVEVLNSPFFPAEKLLMKFPRVLEDGDAGYKVTQIIEFTDRRKKRYCYQFFGEEDRDTYSGVTTYFSYRDDDGDGVFETLGDSCSVPAWVSQNSKPSA